MVPMVHWLSPRAKVLLLVVLVLTGAATSASAQGPGVRGGVSVDPDQFYFGGHYETSALVDRLHFRPNLELGLGDDLVTTALNFEFVYKFPSRSGWRLFAGGGPAVNFYSFDDDDGPGGDDTETEGGLNFLFGAEASNGLFFELKVGAIDSPDLKFGVGWTFR
jgi:hypothetical protein